MVNNIDITNTGEKWIFSDTVAHVGNWSSLLVLEETTIATLTDRTIQEGTLVGEVFPVGTYISGDFSEIQLTSGKVIMYV